MINSSVIYGSATIARRNLRHGLRHTDTPRTAVAIPVLAMLLVVGFFGDALTLSLSGTRYVDYVAPAIILMAAIAAAMSTAVRVSADVANGIIDRFRAMAVSRSAVLTGQVVGGVIQAMISAGLVTGAALLAGFRPTAGLPGWLGAVGVLVLFTFALGWVAAAIGLSVRNAKATRALPLPVSFLPVIGSGFLPVDSMPAAARWFAAHQPATPITETLRGLLTGGPIGANALIALGWCVVLAVGGLLVALRSFHRVSADTKEIP